jgi:hypothetical protein
MGRNLVRSGPAKPCLRKSRASVADATFHRQGKNKSALSGEHPKGAGDACDQEAVTRRSNKRRSGRPHRAQGDARAEGIAFRRDAPASFAL